MSQLGTPQYHMLCLLEHQFALCQLGPETNYQTGVINWCMHNTQGVHKLTRNDSVP